MTGRASAARSAAAFAPQRIGAMVLRYVYILRGSWPRIVELAYWPLMQMVMWGFISKFLATHSSWVAQGAGVLIGAIQGHRLQHQTLGRAPLPVCPLHERVGEHALTIVANRLRHVELARIHRAIRGDMVVVPPQRRRGRHDRQRQRRGGIRPQSTEGADELRIAGDEA